MFLTVSTSCLVRTAVADDDDDAAMRSYLSANGMLNRGLYELAATEYRKFLAEHSDHEKASTARYGLGVSLYRMKRYEPATEALSAIEDDSAFEFAAEVGTIIGHCHLALKNNAEAAKSFQRVVRRHESHELADEAGVGLVEALYLDGQYDEGVDACQRFLSKWSDSPHRERAEFFGAISAMAKKDYRSAADRFAAQLDRFPKGPFADQASLLLAQCYHHNNAMREAIRQYRRVLKQTGSKYIPDALHGLGTLLRRGGNASEAGQVLDQLLEQYPETGLSQSARFQRGRAWFDQGEYEQAFDQLEPLTRTKNDLQDRAAYWAAKCKLRSGEFEAASQRFARAIDEFPDSELLAEMYYDRSIALVRAGQYADATRSLEAYLSRFSDRALAPEALELLATTEHQQKHYTKSRKHCLKFLAQYGSHELAPVVRFLVGENSFLNGDYEDAVADFRASLRAGSDHPQSTEAKFRLGTALYRLQRYDEAVEALAAVTKGRDTVEVYRPALLGLGDIHFQRSEWEQAENYLSDYLSFGANVAAADDALLKLGLSHQRQGENEEAVAAYETLIRQFEDSEHRLQAVFERGQALVALGQDAEAKEAFQSVLDTDRDSRFAPYALNHLAAMAVQDKDFEGASSLYESVSHATSDNKLGADALFQGAGALMAARRFEEAETAFTRFIGTHSDDSRAAEADARRAICMARQDRHADAVSAISRVQRERGPVLSESLKAALGYEKAWCLREMGQSDEAAEAYAALLSDSQREDLSTHAMLELSGIQFNAKRFEEAAKLLRRLRTVMRDGSALVTDELREQATYRLAVCEFELKRFQDAAELFEEFLDAFAESDLTASASYYCGESWFKLGRHGKAVKHLERVAGEFQSSPLLAPSLLRLGECLASLQRWPRSERVFTAYLERFSDSQQWFQAQFGIGWARENQQRYDEAISAYRQVVARHQGPTTARAQFQIGECFFAKTEFELAVREFLKVDILYAYPEWSGAALYEAGRCFEKLGKLVEARAQFKQVVEQHGGSRWADLAAQQLTQVSGASLPGR
jgi:TolA-binding protein